VSEAEQHSSSEASAASFAEGSAAALNAQLTADSIHVDRYEAVWIRITSIVLIVFFLLIVVSAFSVGFQVPGVYQRVDPATLMNADSPFANPTLRELAPGKYEVHIRAQVWQFTPAEIHVPVGSTVTFYVTSQDVQHGFKLAGTNINMMVLPGQISTLKTTFNQEGTFNFVCNEYCGLLHHTMYGRMVVDPVSDSEGNTGGDASGG
jgi:cytochrome c oxidase subunit 2